LEELLLEIQEQLLQIQRLVRSDLLVGIVLIFKLLVLQYPPLRMDLLGQQMTPQLV
jgi:hypothetical protein